MSKDKISDYSATANSNTDIGGINIDEGCAPSGINDAIRTLMKQLKDWQSGSQDVYIHPAGSASVPSITATGDTNTGIFFPAADTVGITTGGTERARVDSSGNLGLGVTPSAWASGGRALELPNGSALFTYTNTSQAILTANAYFNGTNWIYKATNAASNYEQAVGKHIWYTAGSGTAGNAITFTQAMTLDASGNWGLGATSISAITSGYATAHIGGSTGGGIKLGTSSTSYGYVAGSSGGVEIGTTGATSLSFFSNNVTRATIDSSGNLLVGQTTLSQTTVGTSFASNGVVSTAMAASTSAANSYHLYSTGAGAYRFYVSLAGTVNATSTTITGISDQRLKENIRDLDDGLEKVMALQPRKFDWKEGKGAGTKDARGFIAQEFEAVFPDMIEEWLDPAPEGEEPYKAVNANLVPTLVKAIQEQQAIIEGLTARITALEQA